MIPDVDDVVAEEEEEHSHLTFDSNLGDDKAALEGEVYPKRKDLLN